MKKGSHGACSVVGHCIESNNRKGDGKMKKVTTIEGQGLNKKGGRDGKAKSKRLEHH